jgi:hypothetical protein
MVCAGAPLPSHVTVPPTATGVVKLPTKNPGAVRHSNARFVRFIGIEGDRAVYETSSGTYSFIVDLRR